MNIPRFCFFFQLSLMIFCTSGNLFAEDNPWKRKLPFQQVSIKYEISGMESGTETLYVKDHGKYRALHHDGITSMLGFTTKNRRIEITDPDWHYAFDLEDKTGTKTTNPKKIFSEEYSKLSSAEQKNVRKNSQELGISMVKNFQGRTVENAATLLGYDCDRTTVMGITVNVIHKTDVPLLTEMNLMGMKAKTIAVSVDTDSPPPEEAFAFPPGITPVLDQNAEEASRQMITNLINTLKDPYGAEKMKAQMAHDTMQSTASDSESNKGYQNSGSEPSPEDQHQGNAVDESVHQGVELLKGLFGN